MPYVTNAQKEWAGWSDLSSAVDRVCAADQCEESSAIAQLRLAIADGNVRVSWADRSKTYVDFPAFDSIAPPTSAWWWLNQAEFDVRGRAISEEDEPERIGLVKDDWCLAPLYMGQIGSVEHESVWKWVEESVELRNRRLSMALDRIRFRPLLLWYSSLEALWPSPNPFSVAAAANNPNQLPKKRPASECEIVAACEAIYDADADNRPNLNEAYALLRERLPTTTRKRIREVLKSPKFSDMRGKPGIRKRSRPKPNSPSD